MTGVGNKVNNISESEWKVDTPNRSLRAFDFFEKKKKNLYSFKDIKLIIITRCITVTFNFFSKNKFIFQKTSKFQVKPWISVVTLKNNT